MATPAPIPADPSGLDDFFPGRFPPPSPTLPQAADNLAWLCSRGLFYVDYDVEVADGGDAATVLLDDGWTAELRADTGDNDRWTATVALHGNPVAVGEFHADAAAARTASIWRCLRDRCPQCSRSQLDVLAVPGGDGVYTVDNIWPLYGCNPYEDLYLPIRDEPRFEAVLAAATVVTVVELNTGADADAVLLSASATGDEIDDDLYGGTLTLSVRGCATVTVNADDGHHLDVVCGSAHWSGQVCCWLQAGAQVCSMLADHPQPPEVPGGAVGNNEWLYALAVFGVTASSFLGRPLYFPDAGGGPTTFALTPTWVGGIVDGGDMLTVSLWPEPDGGAVYTFHAEDPTEAADAVAEAVGYLNCAEDGPSVAEQAAAMCVDLLTAPCPFGVLRHVDAGEWLSYLRNTLTLPLGPPARGN